MLNTPYVYFQSCSVIAERRPEAVGQGAGKGIGLVRRIERAHSSGRRMLTMTFACQLTADLLLPIR
jgi:hypothetical protein